MPPKTHLVKIHFGFKSPKVKSNPGQISEEFTRLKRAVSPENLWTFNLNLRTLKEKAPSNKDQLPDFLLISNTGRVNLNHIVYDAKPLAVDGVQTEGIFGETGEIDGREAKNRNDYAQFAYMLNHLIHAGKKIPFVMFLAFDTPHSIKDILKRKEKFIEQLKASKRLYLEDENAVEVVYHKNGREHVKIPLIIVVYNPGKNKFYVLDENSMTKMPLREWAGRTKTPAEWIKEKVVEKMENVKADLPDIVELALFNTAIRCCDARSHNLGEIERVVKTLGSILTVDEMIRVMLRNPHGIIHSEFHTTCGYITSATKMYLMLKTLVKLGEDYREAVMAELKAAVSNPAYRMNLDEAFAKNVDEELFKALFASPNKDYQNILVHMINVGVIKLLLEENRILMPSYEKVTEELKKRNMVVPFGVLVYLVTEEIAREQAKRVKVAARRAEKQIPPEIPPLNIDWYFSILSFVDYARYAIPQTVEESVESLERVNEFGEVKKIEEII